MCEYFIINLIQEKDKEAIRILELKENKTQASQPILLKQKVVNIDILKANIRNAIRDISMEYF